MPKSLTNSSKYLGIFLLTFHKTFFTLTPLDTPKTPQRASFASLRGSSFPPYGVGVEDLSTFQRFNVSTFQRFNLLKVPAPPPLRRHRPWESSRRW